MYVKFCETRFPEHLESPFSISSENLVIVVPSEPLGNAMDFSGGTGARRLIDLGERDMGKTLIERGWL